MFVSDSFDLTVQVPADAWATAQRRIAFLEAAVTRLARERRDIQEWFNAEQLAALRLPGLPSTRQGIASRAARGKWPRRPAFAGGGSHFVYHLTSLPPSAFDAIISRLLDLPDSMEFEPAADLAVAEAENTAPPWVLPLMRLMKGEANGNLGRAWRELPAHLPRGAVLPSVDEAARILVNLGLADRVAP